MWQDLLKTAIIGTERNALALPTRNDALGKVLANFHAEDREASLLSAAATVSLYEWAGQVPAMEIAQLPTPCEDEVGPSCSNRSAHHLSLLLGNDEYRELLREWFTALADAGKRVPEESLPILLNLGKTNPHLREPIVNVIGTRGHWLAKQNPDWDYVVDELAESVWETGSQKMRLALLHRLRATDPARARELVTSTWNQETPEDRATFISAFTVGLSLEDETFLEAALDDRRKDVRKAASDLLARLPESAFVQRMIARVKPLLAFKRKVIGKGKIEITLPAECDKAMKRDGIEPKHTYSSIGSLGEKAWWLYQMLSSVPPDLWVAESGWTVKELIDAARNSEWKKLLMGSWTSANRIARNVDWAEPLHTEQFGEDGGLVMLHILPQARQEEIIINLLKQDPSLLSTRLNKSYLIAYRKKWSADLTRLFVESICFHAQKDAFRTEFWWERYLINTSVQFDFETIPEVISRLSQLNNSLPEPSPVLDALLIALDLRYNAIKEIMQ